MKTAIISDIHSNPAALEKVIADARSHGCEKFLCLGDIVGYGYDPNACIDICRERGIECFLGNHDAGLISRLGLDWFNPFAKQAVVRQRPLVSKDNKKWLARLPYNRREGENAFAHGVYVVNPISTSTHFEYVNGYSDAVWQFNLMGLFGIRILFVGHTHCANAFRLDNSGEIHEYFIDPEDEQPIDLSGYHRYIVNVGSCGYPRNQPYSIYCIYDDEKETATHRILEFDFENYRQKMEAANIEIPLWLNSREQEAENRRIEWR